MANLPATSSVDGLMTAADKAKLDAITGGFRAGWTQGNMDNGTHHVAGVFEQEAVAQTVDSGTSPTIDDLGRLHLMINVTTIATAGTLRITGTSYDSDDGSTTGGDTEDIVIGTGNTGYYESVKSWQGNIVLSSVGGVLDCVLDGYRSSLWGHDGAVADAALKHLEWTAEATSPTPSLQMIGYKFDPVARTMNIFYDVTRSGANNKSFGDHRHWDPSIAFAFSAGEGMYFRQIVDTSESLHVEFIFDKT